MEWLIALAAIIIGVLNFIMPVNMIKLSKGAGLKDVEPEEWYIKMTKYSGIPIAFAGVAIIVIPFFL